MKLVDEQSGAVETGKAEGRWLEYACFDNSKYFPALDGLRALSVLLVMANHGTFLEARPWYVYGWTGVYVFFVLSGFLITTLLLREREQRGRVSLKAFYARRFFRILPVYLFTVLLYGVVIAVTQDAAKARELKVALPWLLSFMPEFRPAAAGNLMGHAWTLGIEEKFYVLWPLMVLALMPFRRRRWIWVGAIFLVIAWMPREMARSYSGLLMGAVLAMVLSISGRGKWMPGTWLRRAWLLPEWTLCAMVLGAYFAVGSSKVYTNLFSIVIALLVGRLVMREGWLRRVLGNRVLVYIGKRSYGMYLVHMLVMSAVEKLEPHLLVRNWWFAVMVSYACCIAFAAVIYAVIERPCIAMGRRISQHFQEVPVRAKLAETI